jgi:ATP-dependent helicase/nuclease subunit A
MTIHQSKGLEFPIVFLYKTDEAGMSNAIKSGEVRVDKKLGLLTKVPVDQNYFEEYQTAPIAAMYNYFEDKKNNAELKRLLYVALTRAKDELYITISIQKEGDFKKDSFINLLAVGLKNDFSGNEIILNSELEFLKTKNDKYVNVKEKINLQIPITTDIEIEFEKMEKSIRDADDVEINTSSLHSQEKGEIISASKVSIYNQCPLKYLLTYDYGFGKFNSDYLNFRFSEKSKKESKLFAYEDQDEKDDLRFESFETKIIDYDPALYGRLFHKCMEKSVKTEDLEHFIYNELGSKNQDEAVLKKLLHRLQNDLEYFYRSELFLAISAKENYKNEFEIYVADKDYFLHGILDKIIFDENKISIYDYKTDDIEKKEIKKHSVYYLMQLKFYLYIASKLFSEFDIFEGSLVFVKHPENPVTLSYNKSNLQELELEITNIIKSIRKKNSEKNLHHCKVCSYSGFTNKCIII